MTPRIIIRQEQPVWTRARYSQRLWELYVMNPFTGAYEYYVSCGTFPNALTLAVGVWERTSLQRSLREMEVPC